MSDSFAASCKAAARDLRRLPAELRRQLPKPVQAEVTEPLAAEIRRSWHGPRGPKLAAATKARVQSDPTISVGGRRAVFSGGASVRDVVYGEEFGAGDRVSPVHAGRRSRAHTRHTTRQFRAAGQHAVFGTVEAELPRTFDRWVQVVDRLIGRVAGG